MARLARAAGTLPLVGAVTAAVALAGVAVFSVNQVGCADAGSYVERAGQIELVGSCLSPADLPAAPARRSPAEPAGETGAPNPLVMVP